MFYESIKMGKVRFHRDMAAAVLVSFSVHCAVLIAYSFVAERIPAMKNYRPITVSLVLPSQSMERSPLPFPSAAENKVASRDEGKVEAADAVNLSKESKVEPVQEGVEQIPAKGRSDEVGFIAPQEKDALSKDLSVPSGAISPLSQRPKPASIPASGEGAALPAKGRTGGGEPFSVGTGKENAPGGETAYSGYAKVEASSGSGLVFASPRYSENPLPAYPLPARRRGYAGVVILSVEVLADGRAGRLEIKKTSGYDLLDISALEAVRSWKFSPAKKMGTPVPMWVDVPVRFTLN